MDCSQSESQPRAPNGRGNTTATIYIIHGPPLLYSACHSYSSVLASSENDGGISCSARVKCSCVIRRSARGPSVGLVAGAGGATIDSLTASKAAETHKSASNVSQCGCVL